MSIVARGLHRVVFKPRAVIRQMKGLDLYIEFASSGMELERSSPRSRSWDTFMFNFWVVLLIFQLDLFYTLPRSNFCVFKSNISIIRLGSIFEPTV